MFEIVFSKICICNDKTILAVMLDLENMTLKVDTGNIERPCKIAVFP